MSEQNKQLNTYINGSVLDLSHRAAAGLAKDNSVERDPGFRDLDMIVEMEQADFNIRGAILDAYDEIYDNELDEEHEREFVVGAALAHKGIRFQADLQEEEIPLVDDMSLKGLLTVIKMCKKDDLPYIVDRAWHLERINTQILDTTYEYLENRKLDSGRGDIAFIAGSIVVYELLYQNIATERSIEDVLFSSRNFN
ncbi:MAG: hypothetical protein WCK80_02780 [bacterium]